MATTNEVQEGIKKEKGKFLSKFYFHGEQEGIKQKQLEFAKSEAKGRLQRGIAEPVLEKETGLQECQEGELALGSQFGAVTVPVDNDEVIGEAKTSI